MRLTSVGVGMPSARASAPAISAAVISHGSFEPSSSAAALTRMSGDEAPPLSSVPMPEEKSVVASEPLPSLEEGPAERLSAGTHIMPP